MTEAVGARRVRGYMLMTTAAYLEEAVGGEEGKKLAATLSQETRDALANCNAISWYPLEMQAEVHRLIAVTLGKGDEEAARRALIACGQFMAREATNTFLRLLLRILPPAIVVRRLPDFWARDISFGRLTVVSVDDRHLRCRLSNVGGFDHCAVISAGWVIFALHASGRDIRSTEIRGWSLATPGPDEVEFELHWRV